MCVLYLFVKGRKNIGGIRNIAVDKFPFRQVTLNNLCLMTPASCFLRKKKASSC